MGVKMKREIHFSPAILLAFSLALSAGCSADERISGASEALEDPFSETPLPTDTTGYILPSTEIGTLPGELGVNRFGTATYTVPIWMPTGRHHATPSIQLSYNGSHNDGEVGEGWSLGGTSRITRCGRTVGTDGYTRQPQNDSEDAFCLDGTRLLLVSESGELHGSLFELRPINDPKVRVFGKATASLSAINGPGVTDFEVWLPDGTRLYFGDQHEARVSSPRYYSTDTGGAVLTDGRVTSEWMLTRKVSPIGDDVHFIYKVNVHAATETGANAEHTILSRIDYGGNAASGVEHPFSVVFHYSARKSPIARMSAGLQRGINSILDRIEVLGPDGNQDAQTIREYLLKYEERPHEAPMLGSVQACDMFGRCLPPTEFQYSISDASGFGPPQQVDTAVVDLDLYAPSIIAGDFDSDGCDDIAYNAYLVDDSSSIRIRRGCSTPFGAPETVVTGTAAYQLRPVDVDGDGRLEISTRYVDVPVSIYRRTAWNDFSQVLPHPSPGFESAPPLPDQFYADFDGDSYLDYLIENIEHGTGSSGPSDVVTDVQFGSPSGLTTPNRYPGHLPGPTFFHPTIIDYDGDGRADILRDSHAVAGHAGLVRFDVDRQPILGDTNLDSTTVLGKRTYIDLNGDGLEDELWTDASFYDDYHPLEYTLTARYNLGDGFGPPVNVMPGSDYWFYESVLQISCFAWHCDLGTRVRDLDADGDGDILRFRGMEAGSPDDPVVEILWNTSTGFVSQTLPWIGARTHSDDGMRNVTLADFNGDNHADVVYIGDDHGLYIRYGSWGLPRRLVSVVNGMGKSTEVEYRNWREADDPLLALPLTGAHSRRLRRRSGVVAEVARDDGLGGKNTTEYDYADSRLSNLGEGWLGFGWFIVHEVEQKRTTKQQYDLSGRGMNGSLVAAGPVFSRTTAELDDAGGLQVTDVYRDWELIDEGTRSIDGVPILMHGVQQTNTTVANRSEDEYESFNGKISDVSTVIEARDAWGNATHVAVYNRLTGDVQRTSRTYYNSTEHWLIGLPRRRETYFESTLPDGSLDSYSRSIEFDYDAGTGRVAGWTYDKSTPWELRFEPTFNPTQATSTGVTLTAAGNVGDSPTSSEVLVHYDRHGLYVDGEAVAGEPASWTYTHPSLGVPLVAFDEGGARTSWRYDGFGRLIERQAPGGSTHEARLEPSPVAHHRVTSTSAGGQATRTDYDHLGRPVRESRRLLDGHWASADTQYDTLGRVSSASRLRRDGEPIALTEFDYDGLGRRTETRHPDGTSERFSYVGFSVRHWDQEKRVDALVLDAAGLVRHRVEIGPDVASGDHVSHYTYGAGGRLLRVEQPGGRRIDLGYDPLQRVTTRTETGVGTFSQTFGPFGLVQEDSREGVRTVYSYDASRRLLREVHDLDGETSYDYYEAGGGYGRPAKTTSPDGVVTYYTYDQIGRPRSVSQALPEGKLSVAMSYNTRGQLADLRFEDTHAEEYQFLPELSYDYSANSGELIRISLKGEPVWELLSVSADGRPTEQLFGNGVRQSVGYSQETGRVESFNVRGSDEFVDRTFEYDSLGHLRKETHHTSGLSETFDYDRLGRLERWNDTAGKGHLYGYAEHGSLSFRNESQDPMFLEFDPGTLTPRLRCSDVDLSVGCFGFQYDSLGRRLLSPSGTVVEYNQWDLPRFVSTPKWGKTNYAYSAEGNRAAKWSDAGGTTFYLLDLLEHRQDVAGRHRSVLRVHSPFGEVAQLEVSKGEERLEFLHVGRRASVDLMTDKDGAVVARQFYSPFGRVLEQGSPTLPPVAEDSGAERDSIGFSTHEHEFDTGFINSLGRIYDPSTSRFLTPDAFGGDGIASVSSNPWSYAEQNPLSMYDPTGLVVIDLGEWTDGVWLWHSIWDSDFPDKVFDQGVLCSGVGGGCEGLPTAHSKVPLMASNGKGAVPSLPNGSGHRAERTLQAYPYGNVPNLSDPAANALARGVRQGADDTLRHIAHTAYELSPLSDIDTLTDSDADPGERALAAASLGLGPLAKLGKLLRRLKGAFRAADAVDDGVDAAEDAGDMFDQILDRGDLPPTWHEHLGDVDFNSPVIQRTLRRLVFLARRAGVKSVAAFWEADPVVGVFEGIGETRSGNPVRLSSKPDTPSRVLGRQIGRILGTASKAVN